MAIKMNVLAASLLVTALCAVTSPASAQHVNHDPGSIPPVHRGDIERFCQKGYRSHRWISVVPELGIWMPIWKRFNTQYIPSFVQRCYSGGMIPSNHGI